MSASAAHVELIHDWNGAPSPALCERVVVVDESLRDGLQSPSVQDPPLDQKLELLRLMDAVGVDVVSLGMPCAGQRVAREVESMLVAVRDELPSLEPTCAARTVEADIVPIVELAERTGVVPVAMIFVGSSPVRMVAEGWELADVVARLEAAVRFAVEHGLRASAVTEDTTRAKPDAVRDLYLAAVSAGASRVCICDTVGHATPNGAAALVQFMRRDVLDAHGHARVPIEWHGHNDRGLALANSLAAAAAGATLIHGTALGYGERCGNTPTDQLLLNLDLSGSERGDPQHLSTYCQVASRAFGLTIPPNYPLAGVDAFRTATGVHAAAVNKAHAIDTSVADLVYSAVPATRYGLNQRIVVGPLSGRSNVIHWLERRAFDTTDDIVDRMLEVAKRARRVLRDDELDEIYRSALLSVDAPEVVS